jgi:hypothetical protein
MKASVACKQRPNFRRFSWQGAGSCSTIPTRRDSKSRHRIRKVPNRAQQRHAGGPIAYSRCTAPKRTGAFARLRQLQGGQFQGRTANLRPNPYFYVGRTDPSSHVRAVLPLADTALVGPLERFCEVCVDLILRERGTKKAVPVDAICWYSKLNTAHSYFTTLVAQPASC